MPRRLLSSLLAVAALLAAFALAPGAQRAEAAPLTCPAQFQVLHPDSIGDQTFSAGGYEIKVGDPRRLSCDSATKAFAEFLGDYDGLLRKPWVQVPQRLIYSRGVGSVTQFAVRRASEANPAIPADGNPTAFGCTGFFRLPGTDHVGSLPIAPGAYRISLTDPRSYDCLAANRQLTRFLEDFDGRLAGGWKLNTKTGEFRRSGSLVGFRIKKAVGAETTPQFGARFPAAGEPRECKGTYRLRVGDRINNLFLPAGDYLTFPLKGGGASCARVSSLFSRFLRAKNNRAPKGWSANTETGVVKKGKRPVFRVKPALKPVAVAPDAPAAN